MRSAARWALYLGIAGVVVGLSLAHARLIAEPPYDYVSTSRFGWSLVYMGVLAIVAYGLGLPDVPSSPRQALGTSLGAAVAAAVGMSVVQLLVGDALLPRFVVFGSAILLVPWYVLCVGLAGGGTGGAARDRVLVIGDGIDGPRLRDEVSRSPEKPALVVSILPVNAVLGTVDPTGSSDAVAGDGGPTLLVDRARRDRITVVVLDRDAQASSEVVAQAVTLHEAGVRVRTLSLFYEEWLGMLPITELERVSLLFDIGEIHRSRYSRVKRIFDVAVALVGCVALALVLPFVVLGDLVANRGPLFYRQPRVGKNGKTFDILKFRTMRADGDVPANEWTRKDDPRITPFGALLRTSHLDELPQVVNILRGELSAVGPRPEQPHYVDELKEKLPFYDVRHLVRPGLTGWAQVKYGYAGDETDALEKLQYEFYYLRRQRLSLDLRIVGRTVRSVLLGQGR
jgi:lipopolysaccharide/colanic/teichoic acid biosynthesis glycosyltransferase